MYESRWDHGGQFEHFSVTWMRERSGNGEPKLSKGTDLLCDETLGLAENQM